MDEHPLRSAHPAFIERDAHLAAIDQLADSTRGARLVLITGEAGIGKTRLMREYSARASSTRRSLRIETDAGLLDAPDLPNLVTTTGSAEVAFGGALADSLRRRFGDGPGLVLLEDLHRLDPTGVRSLSAVLDAIDDLDMLLIATYRVGAHATGTPEAGAVAELVRHPATCEIALPPLTVDGVGRLAAALGRDVDDAETAAIHRRTGGNPFFVEQLLLLDDPGVPWSVSEAVLGQLEGLGAEARTAADVLAVATDPVPGEVVEAVGGTRAGLRSLTDARLAIRVADGWIALRHELVAQVVVERIDDDRRRRLHAAIAERLEADGRTPASRLARHWASAGEPVRAASWAAIAADHALAHRFYRTATELYRIAVAGELDGLAQAELCDRAAVAAGWAGSDAEAIEWATVADAAYRQAGETWRAVAMWMSPGLARIPKPVHEAVPGAPGSPEQMIAAARACVGRGERERAAALLRRVIDQAAIAGEHHWQIEAALRLVGAGYPAEGDHVLGRVRALAVASGDDATLAHAASTIAYVALACGDATRALESDRTAAAAAARNPETVAWPLDAGVATILALMGQIAEATQIVDELLHGGPRLAAEFAQLPAALIDLAHGDVATARDRINRMVGVDTLAVTQLIIAVDLARAELALADGDPAGALQTLHRADALTNEVFEATRLDRLLLNTKAAIALDLDEELGAVHSALDELRQLHDGPEIEAAITYVRGAIASRAADATASGLIETAAEQWERCGRIRHAAEAWCDLAQATDDPRLQDRSLDRARRLADRHDLLAVHQRIGDLERRSEAAGIRRAFDGLTDRERAIADRVARGMTNRQIATALHISEHTVRNHLVNVYDKLGVARRAELAAMVATHPSRD